MSAQAGRDSKSLCDSNFTTRRFFLWRSIFGTAGPFGCLSSQSGDDTLEM